MVKAPRELKIRFLSWQMLRGCLWEGFCLGKSRGEGSAGACGKVFVLANVMEKARRVLVARFLSWQMLGGCWW